jgi:hypothetical protein
MTDSVGSRSSVDRWRVCSKMVGTAEVTRLCTDGSANACSMLYGAAWRAAKAIGYRQSITYTLVERKDLPCEVRIGAWSDRPEAVAGPGQEGLVSTATPQGKKFRWEWKPAAEHRHLPCDNCHLLQGFHAFERGTVRISLIIEIADMSRRTRRFSGHQRCDGLLRPRMRVPAPAGGLGEDLRATGRPSSSP